MIYATVSADQPLQQGDIFRHIPRAELSLSEMAILSDDQQTETASWTEFSSNGGGEVITAVVGIQSVMAVVITQNCDNARGKDVCLCSIEPFIDAFNIQGQAIPKNAKSWQKTIMKYTKNPRYFYLPEREDIGIAKKMVADFRTVLRVPRIDLLKMRWDFRIARLNSIATEHFRESLGNFFRRYAYNEWYPLNKEEVESYASAQHLDASDLYDWQK